MASLGHVAVGLAFARRYRTPAQVTLRRAAADFGLFAALALLPDLDVLAFHFGIPYAAPFGHRGAAHSLTAALLIAALATLLLQRQKPGPRFFLFALAAVASHGLLDTLTDGGLGVALLWPFSNARTFAPWRPIPVAPIGARMLGARGLHVVLVETLLFAPLLAYAIWPRRNQ